METKRKASSDLNHDNWDREEEPEEKGTFQTASENILKNRVIKKARRNLGSGAENDTGGTKSIFSGFSGFTSTESTTVSPAASNTPFSFLSKLSGTTSQGKSETIFPTVTKPAETDSKFAFNKSSTYYSKLKGLNQAVSDWIKTHVDKNPLCILTPIFKDYEKYLKEIQEEKVEGTSSGPSCSSRTFEPPPPTTKESATEPDPPPKPAFTFSFASSTSTSAKPKDGGFQFGKQLSSPQKESKLASFSFKPSSSDVPDVASSKSSIFSSSSSSGVNSAASSATAIPTGFTFSSSKPFTFSNVAKPPETAEPKADGEAEEDEPPKVEFTPVVEEDNVYSKRCKVFIKTEGNYSDRGIGTLYLKPIKDSEKTQLIVRADTNLGNILLNFILNESIPAQRMGKNNVMMVCIPTPEADAKPNSILLRVKTGDDADELLNTINKYKK